MATDIHAMPSGLFSQAGGQGPQGDLTLSARKRKARMFQLDGRVRLPFETDDPPAYLLPASDFFSSQGRDHSAFKQELPPRDPKLSRLEYIHLIRNYIGIQRVKKKRDFGLDKTNTMDLFADEAQNPTPQRLSPAPQQPESTLQRDSSVKKQSWIAGAAARRSSEQSKEGTDSAGGARRLTEALSKNSAGPSGAGPSAAGLGAHLSPAASGGSAGAGSARSGRASVGVRAGSNERVSSDANSKGKRHSGVEEGRRAGESSHKKGAVTPGSAAGHASFIHAAEEEEHQAHAHETPGGASAAGDGGEDELQEDDIRQADAFVGSILEQLAPLTEDDGYRNPLSGGRVAGSLSPAASAQHGAAGNRVDAAGNADADDQEEEQETSGKAAKGKGKGRGRDQKGKKASGSTSVKAPSEGPRRSTRNSKEAGSKEAEQINAGVNNPVEEENDNVGENADMEDDMDLGNDDVGDLPEEVPVRGAKKSERAAPATHPLRLEAEETMDAASRRKRKAMRTSLGGFGTVLDNGIRRSTRVRLRPLQYWRNEHVIYGRVHLSLPTVVQVELKAPLPEWPKLPRERRVNTDLLPLTHSNFPY